MSPLVGAGHARVLLDLTAAQLSKVRDSGLVGSVVELIAQQTNGGQWRYDEEAVRALAARLYVDLGSSETNDLAVHLRPLQPARDGSRRSYLGWSVTAAQQGLNPRQREEAWAGWWPCADPDRYVGGALVGDISGFVVEVARITGWTRDPLSARVRFILAKPTAAMRKTYSGRRFRAGQGSIVQPLTPSPSPGAATGNPQDLRPRSSRVPKTTPHP